MKFRYLSASAVPSDHQQHQHQCRVHLLLLQCCSAIISSSLLSDWCGPAALEHPIPKVRKASRLVHPNARRVPWSSGARLVSSCPVLFCPVWPVASYSSSRKQTRKTHFGELIHCAQHWCEQCEGTSKHWHRQPHSLRPIQSPVPTVDANCVPLFTVGGGHSHRRKLLLTWSHR